MRNAIPISFMLCIMIICAGTVAAQQKGPAEAAALFQSGVLQRLLAPTADVLLVIVQAIQ